MPGLEDFLTKLDSDALSALTEYKFLVDEVSLDYVKGQNVRAEFQQMDVALEHDANTGTYILRGANDSDTTRNSLRIWYLPWKHWDGQNEMSGVSKAVLDNRGPGLFLTSQLNGCRFTIQDQSGDGSKVTVLHLAGNYGQNLKGAQARETVEAASLENVANAASRRRYSIGQYSKNPKYMKLPNQGVRSYYDGGMATVLGVRSDGKWQFYAQQFRYDASSFVSTKAL
ncbi:MAG: hypothetical protein VYA55_07860 [Pseudomonadota bacterium]|nr:hypothetical protein [Pseudomonadota bacterium]